MLKIVLLVAAVTLVSSEYDSEYDSVHSDSDSDWDSDWYSEPSLSERHFSIDLLRVMNERSGGNMIFSPYSIYRVLLLTCFGAKGETEASLKKVLHLEWAQSKRDLSMEMKGMQSGQLTRAQNQKIQFNSVDKIYVTQQAALKPEIHKLLGNENVESVDFASNSEGVREKINKFIEDVTHGNIKDMLSSTDVNPWTNVVLANAAFFKGKWLIPFNPELTEEMPFYGFQTAPVNMMSLKSEFPSGKLSDLGVQFLEMPYACKDWSIVMHIFLPLENSPTAIDDVLAKFEPSHLEKAMRREKQYIVDIKLPRMNFNSSTLLGSDLGKMGIKELFGASANLTDFSDDVRLSFGDILHNAKIEINEQGSTASAATVSTSRGMPQYTKFVCDHPFAFVIHDRKTTNILFVGVYRGPDA